MGERRPWLELGAEAPADFADFATAAARRYPQVHLWMIWGSRLAPTTFCR